MKAISQRNFVERDYLPETCNLFNKLLREIVTLATKPLFFITLHVNEMGLDKKVIWERRIDLVPRT